MQAVTLTTFEFIGLHCWRFQYGAFPLLVKASAPIPAHLNDFAVV
jgi:hypothetical protein